MQRIFWLRDLDSNQEPSGYGPDELPIALSRALERVTGVEPVSYPWQGHIIAAIRYPRNEEQNEQIYLFIFSE